MQILNITNIMHPTMQCKIHAAMARTRVNSLNTGHSVTYLKNKKGHPIMRIEHKRGLNGGFTFYRGNKCLKAVVLQSLRQGE